MENPGIGDFFCQALSKSYKSVRWTLLGVHRTGFAKGTRAVQQYEQRVAVTMTAQLPSIASTDSISWRVELQEVGQTDAS